MYYIRHWHVWAYLYIAKDTPTHYRRISGACEFLLIAVAVLVASSFGLEGLQGAVAGTGLWSKCFGEKMGRRWGNIWIIRDVYIIIQIYYSSIYIHILIYMYICMYIYIYVYMFKRNMCFLGPTFDQICCRGLDSSVLGWIQTFRWEGILVSNRQGDKNHCVGSHLKPLFHQAELDNFGFYSLWAAPHDYGDCFVRI